MVERDQIAAGNVGRPNWHALPVEAAIEALDADAAHGLHRTEAETRLARFGPNALRETGRVRWPTLLGRQFASTLIAILLVAAAISLAVGEGATPLPFSPLSF